MKKYLREMIETLRKNSQSKTENPNPNYKPPVGCNRPIFDKSLRNDNYSFSLKLVDEHLIYTFSYSSKLFFRLKRTVHYHNFKNYCLAWNFNFSTVELYADGQTAFLLSTQISVPYCDLFEFENSKEFQNFLRCLQAEDIRCCNSESPEGQVEAVGAHYKRIEDILCD